MQVALPTDGKLLVASLRDWLHARIQQTDEGFPSNQYLSFEKGELILHPLAKQVDPEGLALLERIVAERLKPISILHAVMHTEQWLGLSALFCSPVRTRQQTR